MRRLLRRACRHGRLLGIKGAFLVELAQTVIDGSKDGYPELEEKKDFILKVIAKEEDQFNKTIDQGLGILRNDSENGSRAEQRLCLDADAFKLYDTYGFPIDLTKEILEEKRNARWMKRDSTHPWKFRERLPVQPAERRTIWERM